MSSSKSVSKVTKDIPSTKDYEYALHGYSRIHYQEHQLIPESLISLIAGFLNFWQQFVVTADQCRELWKISEDPARVHIPLDPFYFGQFKFETRLVAVRRVIQDEKVRVKLRLEMALPNGIFSIGGYFGYRSVGENAGVRYDRVRRRGTKRWWGITKWFLFKSELQKAKNLSFAQYLDIRQVQFMYTPDTIDIDDIDIMPPLSKTGHHQWEMDGKLLMKGQETDVEGWRIWTRYFDEDRMVQMVILPSHLPLQVWSFVLKITVNGTIKTIGHEIVELTTEEQIEIDCHDFSNWPPGPYSGFCEVNVDLPDAAHLEDDSTIALAIDWEVVKVHD